jgi:hypothetical protein
MKHVAIRFAIDSDYPQLESLERIHATDAWTATDYRSFIGSSREVVHVSCLGGILTGSLCLSLESDLVRVHRMFVASHAAETLALFVAKIRNSLTKSRSRAEIIIDETKTWQLVSLCDCGFRTCGIVWGHFGDRDGVRLGTELLVPSGAAIPQNRISNYLEA